MTMGYTIERNVILSHLNEDGNRVLDFPITKSENVDGLDKRIEEVSSFKLLDCGTLSDNNIVVNSSLGG
jgi:hypothetical protein